MDQIFMSPPERERRPRLLVHVVADDRASTAHMDPPRAGKYWRSVIGNLNLLAGQWRASAR